MYLSRKASKARLREAQNARDNRAEIVRGLSQGQFTRRDLIKWGIFTAGGMLVAKNGLSPFAKSAFASSSIPTGTPPSPTFGALPFTQAMPRLALQEPVPLVDVNNPDRDYGWQGITEDVCKRLSYHTDYSDYAGDGANPYRNPLTGIGPMEGRAPGEFYAHQRWDDYSPKVGYLMSIGQIEPNTKFHPNMPAQEPNQVWTFGSGKFARGRLPPPLIKARYGEPVLTRIFNNLPIDRAQNGGFGRNEMNIHNHNAHNGAESDGANNCHFFPGQCYDYHWGLTLARADENPDRRINELQNSWGLNKNQTAARAQKLASGPDGNGGLIEVPGDFRELQGTLWFHDHRFFFTAENVYKGFAGMLNYYSGPDRGHEELNDGVNHRLPSGTALDSGNLDFDVNLLIADMALDQDGQYFFDIFDTDGFLGDLIHVNYAYRPYFEVLPRKYRFRILSASMSRFLKLALTDESGNRVKFQFIANDGNFLVHPLTLRELDIQGVAERYDIVVDFSQFSVGDKFKLVNMLEFSNGRGPDRVVPLAEALASVSDDPVVGPIMEFRIVDTVQSVDDPSVWHHAGDPDNSQVPDTLTEQVPIVEPVRVRHVEFKRGGGDSRDTTDGECIPDCGDRESFPWTISVNGEETHSLNANRISMLIPKSGDVEHWTIENGGGGWDHPIHLHTEEGVTMDRGDDFIPETERLVRKDVWRLREGGKVRFQVRFGEFGGAYVNHCHNTVHEDNAMLLRFDILTDPDLDAVHAGIIPTPLPRPEGVSWMTPEILPEGDYANPDFFPVSDGGGGGGGGKGGGKGGGGGDGGGGGGKGKKPK